MNEWLVFSTTLLPKAHKALKGVLIIDINTIHTFSTLKSKVKARAKTQGEYGYDKCVKDSCALLYPGVICNVWKEAKDMLLDISNEILIMNFYSARGWKVLPLNQ